MNSEVTVPIELAAAIVDAQSRAQAVAKRSENPLQNYRYASAEDVITASRGALNGAGLALLTLGWHVLEAVRDEGLPRVVVAYRLLHRSGQCLDFEGSTPVLPEHGRPDDKAEATALTYNLSYTLRGLLLLPRDGSNDDVDARDDRAYAPPGRRPAPEPEQWGREVPLVDVGAVAVSAELRRTAAAVIASLDEQVTAECAEQIVAPMLRAKLPKAMRDDTVASAFLGLIHRAQTSPELEALTPAIMSASLEGEAYRRVRAAWGARARGLEGG